MNINKLDLNSDILLIIECSKDDYLESRIIELCKSIKDWNKFISLARCHGVFPLVYRTLKKLDLEYVSEETIEKMKKINLSIVKDNMLMTSELLTVTKLLNDNNIDMLSFKGPLLAKEAYLDISLRQYCDLDILVKKDNVYRIEELLKKKDYKRNLELLNNSQEKAWFKYSHDLSLSNKSGINLELHWKVFDSDHPINLSNLNFWENKKEVLFNKNVINTFSNEEMLIYLCVHGSKHLFERIEWIVDIDKFIRTQYIDWGLFEKLIKNTNFEKFVLLGLFLSNELYKTPIFYRNKIYKNDILKVSNYIFDVYNKKIEFTNKNNLKAKMCLFTSFNDKIKFLHKVYLKPTFTEYWYITFPKPLYFLYYPLRQYLLLKKYIFKSS